MADFYTQSSNFVSAVAGGMDPRTGLFSATIPLGKLVGNNELGPILDLALAYSPLSAESNGFGTGCSLGLSRYDTDTGSLSLSNGERYRVLETSTGAILQQKKLKNLRFERQADAYKIIYPTGLVEVLTGPDNAYSMKVPVRLYSPLGHSLTLTWDFSMGPQPRLTAIADETDTLLRISYGGPSTRLTFWPGKAEAYSVRLIFLNGYVVRTENDAIDPPVVSHFGYSQVGAARILTRLEDAAGLVDEVVYQEDGHHFPDAAHLPPLPYVTARTQYPGNDQPPVVTRFSYSSHNYVGGGTSNAWSADEDYLYAWLSDYSYSSTETVSDGGTSRSTNRTYNNFHLLTKEEVAQGVCRRTTTTQYYAVVGRVFDRQLPQFQFPKTVSVVHAEGQRVGKPEVTLTQFDESGNLIRMRKPDGTVTQYVHYPAQGEGDACPPDPHGFVHFLKAETTTPAPASFASPEQVRRLTYRAIPGVANSGVASVVVSDSEKIFSGDRRIAVKQYVYVDSPQAAEHGRLQRTATTLYAEGNTGASYSSHVDLVFKVTGGALEQRTTFTGHDGLSTVQSETRSRFSGRVRSETDDQGNVTRYALDGLGRIVTETVNPGSAYERTSTWTYTRNVPSGSSVRLVDNTGNMSIVVFDALGRLVQRKTKDLDAAEAGWHVVMQSEFDALGRVVSTTQFDMLRDTGDGERKISSTTTVAYDNWNRTRALLYADGRQEISDYDPVKRIEKKQLRGGGLSTGVEEIHYNLQGLITRQVRRDGDDRVQGTVKHSYDGLGRLRSIVDALGQATAYGYDDWGRVIKTTLPGGTVQTKRYAPHATSSLVTSIAVDGTSLGTQSFDSLGRVVKSIRGGRTINFRYTGASPNPTKVTTPAAQAIAYKYISKLGNAVQQIAAPGIVRTFTYDPGSALVSGAIVDGGMATKMVYYPSGRPKEEAYTFGTNSRTAKYVWSAQGLIQAYDDVSGKVQYWRYDKYGRPKEVADTDVNVALKVDAMSRLTGWRATDLSSGSELATTLAMDDLNREVKRTITGAEGTVVVRQEYRLNDQLGRRVTTRDEVVLRDEKYRYDARNRLIEYRCAGTAPPTCEYGKRIASRRFTYDALNNITRIVTTFHDETKDTATYLYKNKADPARLTAVRHTHPAYPPTIQLAYDKLGCLTADEAGRTLSYDAFARLQQVSVPGKKGAGYHYDAFDKLVRQTLADTDMWMYYRGGELVNEIRSKDAWRYLRAGDSCVAQRNEGTRAGTWLMGVDMAGTVLEARKEKETLAYAYTPYGHVAAESHGDIGLGYNGERMDPLTGVSHLGNGYRAYNPALMRFNAPDSMSPFGAGGPNPYAYCEADPINASDPSGHLSTQAWIGIGFGIFSLAMAALTVFTMGASLGVLSGVGVALGVTSGVTGILSGALETVAPTASEVLGWVSLATGVVGAGAEIGAAVKAARAARAIARVADAGAGALTDGARPIGKNFLLFQGGRTADNAADTLLVSSHGMEFMGKTRAPANVRFFGPSGQSVADVGLTEAATRLRPMEQVAEGRAFRNHLMQVFGSEAADAAAVAETTGTDVLILANTWRTRLGLVTTSDLFKALDKAGSRYAFIDLYHCRPGFLQGIGEVLLPGSKGVPTFHPRSLSGPLSAWT
jgi:RHS repeat-associated protein